MKNPVTHLEKLKIAPSYKKWVCEAILKDDDKNFEDGLSFFERYMAIINNIKRGLK